MTNRLKAFGMLAVAFACWSGAIAQALNPASYIDIELEVRQITNEGMQQRLLLIKLQSEDSVEDQFALDAETYHLINAVYEDYGVTAGSHVAYGTQNTAIIERYLGNHPEMEQKLESVQSEFELYSSQISAALTGQ